MCQRMYTVQWQYTYVCTLRIAQYSVCIYVHKSVCVMACMCMHVCVRACVCVCVSVHACVRGTCRVHIHCCSFVGGYVCVCIIGNWLQPQQGGNQGDWEKARPPGKCLAKQPAIAVRPRVSHSALYVPVPWYRRDYVQEYIYVYAHQCTCTRREPTPSWLNFTAKAYVAEMF